MDGYVAAWPVVYLGIMTQLTRLLSVGVSRFLIQCHAYPVFPQITFTIIVIMSEAAKPSWQTNPKAPAGKITR